MFFHKKRNIHGLLLLDKPSGLSSNNVLQKIKFIFKAKKAGYIGTLDPLATGVLPICFGESTKFSHYLTDSDKKYHVIAKLGERTSTADSEGVVIKKRPVLFSSIKLNLSMKELTGLICQTPSMYSAIKYNGIPLYKYARKGLNIIRKKRSVWIYKIDVLNHENNLIEFNVHCSKGTYIRNLVEDLGEKLGCGAHVVFLRRLQVALYNSSKLVKISDLYQLLKVKNFNNINYFKKLDNLLMPIDSLVSFFPKTYLSTTQTYHFKLGKKIILSSKMNNGLTRVKEKQHKTFIGLGKISNNILLTPHRLISNFS